MEIQKTEVAKIQKEQDEVEECEEQHQQAGEVDEDESELKNLLLSDIGDLPICPPSATQVNFVSYFITDFVKSGHDQYIYRHANGLCVIGLAPTHKALKDESGITRVDFKVGKSDRSKSRKHALRSDSITSLCRVRTANGTYIVRCCVKGSLLEVNKRLIKQPRLLNSSADREGYIAIIMSTPEDWIKVKESLLITLEEYKEKKELS